MPVASARLAVDSDNDTHIDRAKDEAAREAFAFWQEANPTPGAARNSGQDALLDFAPIRLYTGTLPPGTLHLELEESGYTANFLLARNVGVPLGASDTQASASELKYLTDPATA